MPTAEHQPNPNQAIVSWRLSPPLVDWSHLLWILNLYCEEQVVAQGVALEHLFSVWLPLCLADLQIRRWHHLGSIGWQPKSTTNGFYFHPNLIWSNFVSCCGWVHSKERLHPVVYHQWLKEYWNDWGQEPLHATKVQFYGETNSLFILAIPGWVKWDSEMAQMVQSGENGKSFKSAPFPNNPVGLMQPIWGETCFKGPGLVASPKEHIAQNSIASQSGLNTFPRKPGVCHSIRALLAKSCSIRTIWSSSLLSIMLWMERPCWSTLVSIVLIWPATAWLCVDCCCWKFWKSWVNLCTCCSNMSTRESELLGMGASPMDSRMRCSTDASILVCNADNWPTGISLVVAGCGCHGSRCSHGSSHFSSLTAGVDLRLRRVFSDASTGADDIGGLSTADESGVIITSPWANWKIQWLGGLDAWISQLTPDLSLAWPCGPMGRAGHAHDLKIFARDAFVAPYGIGPMVYFFKSPPFKKTRSGRWAWCTISALSWVTRMPYLSPDLTRVESHCVVCLARAASP